MKNTKTQLRYFSVPAWKKEEAYLRQMHQKGWRLVRVSGFGVYHFERCEGEDVVYQLDYNPDGIAHKDEYVKMFGDCGWEYLQDYMGYSYFRKAAAQMDGDEEIFCDDASRMDMMKRVFKGRMVPLLVIFFAIILPQLLLQSSVDTPLSRGIRIAYCVLFVVYLALFISFAIHYYKALHRE